MLELLDEAIEEATTTLPTLVLGVPKIVEMDADRVTAATLVNISVEASKTLVAAGTTLDMDTMVVKVEEVL